MQTPVPYTDYPKCEMSGCTTRQSHDKIGRAFSRYCDHHTCEGDACFQPTVPGKKYCHQCACAQRGCVQKRNVYRRHKFCLDHGCDRCTTRPCAQGLQQCEDCYSRCHQAGNMCNASKAEGSLYCREHTCLSEDCQEHRYEFKSYCRLHECVLVPCRQKRWSGEKFCQQCLGTCLALPCSVTRPEDHVGPYYCDQHGCADCHKAPRHWWCSQRKRMQSRYCQVHYQKDLCTQQVVYEMYKRRKMVEAGAVVSEGGNPNTLEHIVFRNTIPSVVVMEVKKEDLACVANTDIAAPKATNLPFYNVLAKVMDKEWKDDLFTRLMECYPRSLPFTPMALGSTEDITTEQMVQALSPVTRDINTALMQKQKGSIIVRYCDYDYGLVRLPRVCPTTVVQKRRVVCKSTGESMYRLSGIVRKRGTDLYHDHDTYFAWTVPVSYVEGFEHCSTIAHHRMLRFEEIEVVR